jgi:hypothetical protein
MVLISSIMFCMVMLSGRVRRALVGRSRRLDGLAVAIIILS